MAIKFQYNKTALNNLNKQLKMRKNALPTLQNKESALRLEVRKAKDESERLIDELQSALDRYDYLAALWNEFDPGLIAITGVDLSTVKVAGVKCPRLDEVHYELRPFNAFVKPAWYPDGVAILKEISRLGIEFGQGSPAVHCQNLFLLGHVAFSQRPYLSVHGILKVPC